MAALLLTFDSTLITSQAHNPSENLLFNMRRIVFLSTSSHTLRGTSIQARFILTLTPASVLLDISKQPSLHQLIFLSASSIAF